MSNINIARLALAVLVTSGGNVALILALSPAWTGLGMFLVEGVAFIVGYKYPYLIVSGRYIVYRDGGPEGGTPFNFRANARRFQRAMEDLEQEKADGRAWTLSRLPLSEV